MTALGTLEPTAPQLQRLLAASVADGEAVVMINLLRFKERADGIDAEDGISGAEAYGRYAAAVGAHEHEWDMVIAVQYPSRQAFLEMTGDPEYLKIHGHRTAALADSRLIACAPLGA